MESKCSVIPIFIIFSKYASKQIPNLLEVISSCLFTPPKQGLQMIAKKTSM